MQDYLYTAMNGARHALASQQVHANNLANASTTGFKQDVLNAKSYQVEGKGLETQVVVETAGSSTNFKPGALQSTGRDLDVAIQGRGFLAVMDENGQEAYTRSGNFQLGPEGQVYSNNRPVMGAGGPLVIPENEGIAFGSNGELSIKVQGGGIAQVDQLKLVNPELNQMTKGSDGLFRAANGGQFNQDENVLLVSKHIENSNVNAVDSMVANMALSRDFEMQVKMMKAADENSKSGNQLIRGS